MMTLKSALLGCILSLATTTAYADIINYGDPAFDHLLTAMHANHVHIMQIGDSHTAGDDLTEAMRQQLQSVMGNGGFGYAMPMWFRGQKMAQISYDNTAFMPITSRNDQSQSYTLGGMIARPTAHLATLSLKPKKAQNRQQLTISIQQAPNDGHFSGIDATGERFVLQAPIKNNTWQLAQIYATLPITLTAHNANSSALGGFWGTSTDNTGAIVSALGINGATIHYWQRWQTNAWQQEMATLNPHLVILSYGTNEAHSHADPVAMANAYDQVIEQIRKASPTTAIMLLVAPESLQSSAGKCGVRPNLLTNIQQAQYQIAKHNRTLLWDWQQAMGGVCSMKAWIKDGLAAKDGVHFSRQGYQKIGNMLAYDLLKLKDKQPNLPNSDGRFYIIMQPNQPTVSMSK